MQSAVGSRRHVEFHHSASATSTILVFSLALTLAQQATQFLPDDVPQVAQDVTERLSYRQTGFQRFWQDQNVQKVFLAAGAADPLHLTAQLQVGTALGSPELDFNQLQNVMLIDSGARLEIRDLLLSNIPSAAVYVYSEWQPWRNAGAGFPLWPAVALAPNATLVLTNVGIRYPNPAPWDTCEQYNAKVVFGTRQVYGRDNVSVVNGTASIMSGPVVIQVAVLQGNGSNTDAPGGSTLGLPSFVLD
eukprot:gene8840-9019_t